MKKISVFVLMALVLAVTACKEGKTNNENENNNSEKVDSQSAFDLKLYRTALEQGDAYTAIAALNSYILRDSSHIQYRDTLLQLYLQTQQLMASYQISSDILEDRPNDTLALQANVASAYELGAMDKAITSVKKLLEIDPTNLSLKFQYGQSLLQRNDVAEGLKIVQEVIDDPKAKQTKVPYTAFENGRQVQREVNLNLAAIMLMGQYYAQTGNFDKSETYFRLALKINPKFKEAAQAILDLKALKAQGGR